MGTSRILNLGSVRIEQTVLRLRVRDVLGQQLGNRRHSTSQALEKVLHNNPSRVCNGAALTFVDIHSPCQRQGKYSINPTAPVHNLIVLDPVVTLVLTTIVGFEHLDLDSGVVVALDMN